MTRHTMIVFLVGVLQVFLVSARSADNVKGVTLTPYLADSTANTGIAVIVCPGGSYSWLDMKNEGFATARWLKQNGINAFVLKYRVATISAYVFGYRALGLGHRYPDMLYDVEWALQQVYEQADSLSIDTASIGVMGFSAGGHLAMLSFLHNNTDFKPHFICSVYPVVTMSRPHLTHKRSRRGALGVWGQFNKQMQDSLSLEKQVTDDCPPVFLVNCKDDPTVRYENSLLLDSALTQHNVPHLYTLYETGGHGFGTSDNKGTTESQQWKHTCLEWILNINR